MENKCKRQILKQYINKHCRLNKADTTIHRILLFLFIATIDDDYVNGNDNDNTVYENVG